ncbi:MAG: TonB-dependent receptor [Bacteroidota bacterium]
MITTRGNIVLLFWLLFLAQANGQPDLLNHTVDIRFENHTVSAALEKLMEKTNCTINYQPSDLPEERRVTKSFERTEIEIIIKEIWGRDDLVLRTRGDNISIKIKTREQLDQRGSLYGYLTNEREEYLPFATIAIKGTNTGAITDEKGFFEINPLEAGSYVLVVLSTGYQTKEVAAEVRSGQQKRLNISLEESVSTLDEVIVEGESIARQISEEPIAISTVDALKMQAQTQDVAKVLDKVEGVRIRQSGGLGSQTAISINGLTGNAIRFYYNGIPSEFLGGGFELNTLPISNVDRIEVYKGVMPASIGTDALGGGINITTNQDRYEAFDFSYQYGSFNTHRVAGSITRSFNDKWFFNLNANYNYSDNDYEMEVQNNLYDPSLPFPVGTETINVRRFHDAFSSFLGDINFGYINRERQLSFNIGAYVTARAKEVQHGVRVGFVPFGEMDYKGQDTYLKFDLEKNFGQKWEINYLGIAGYSRVIVDDSTQSIYDWNGNNITLTNPAINRENGAELFLLPSKSDVYNYNTVNRVSVKRNFKKDISLSVHHFFAYQDRTGSESIEVNFIGGRDPNETGFQIGRNISSLELKKFFFDRKLELLSTVKSYQYTTKGINTTLRGRDLEEIPLTTLSKHEWGYNLATKWSISKNFFIRASYEDALRIPTQSEIFGDLRTVIPNFSLNPERSKNLNAGFNANFTKVFKVNLNYFYRSQRDLIFLQIIDLETAQFINRDKVQSAGFELSLRGEPIRNLTYTWNVTYFDIQIKGVNDIRDQFLLGSPVPNIPTFFSNLGLGYTLDDFLAQDNRLTVNADLQFIDEFSFIQEGNLRNDDNWVPVQYAVDLGLTYHFLDKMSFNFQVNNVFDRELFDFISVPKPGRNYAVKLRYQY